MAMLTIDLAAYLDQSTLADLDPEYRPAAAVASIVNVATDRFATVLPGNFSLRLTLEQVERDLTPGQMAQAMFNLALMMRVFVRYIPAREREELLQEMLEVFADPAATDVEALRVLSRSGESE